jgi:hypothetical protein
VNAPHAFSVAILAVALLTATLLAALAALLATLLAALAALLATLLAALAALLATLLALPSAGFLFTTLTAWSLLTSALLTATLIVFLIVCHVLPPLRLLTVQYQSVLAMKTEPIQSLLHSFKTDCSLLS